MASTPGEEMGLGLDTIRAQIVEPIEQLLQKGAEKEQEIRAQIEDTWEEARAKVAALRERVEALEAELSPARSTLRRFDPEHKLLAKPDPIKKKAGKVNFKPREEHVLLLQTVLRDDGQLTSGSALAALREKFGNDVAQSTVSNVLLWMRQEEMIRHGGVARGSKGGGSRIIYKAMHDESEDVTVELSEEQVEVMAVVNQHPGITSAILASELGISRPAASSRLKRLYDEGHIVRVGTAPPEGGHGRVAHTYSAKASANGDSA